MIMVSPAAAVPRAGKEAAVLAVVVTVARGYDLGERWLAYDVPVKTGSE